MPLPARLQPTRYSSLSSEVLYPALHRLERQKWIRADWKLSENNQRVKLYRLTRGGKKHLTSERSRWEQLQEAIAGVLNRGAKESGIRDSFSRDSGDKQSSMRRFRVTLRWRYATG